MTAAARKAARRAEACFAVARSATFAGERDSAIRRGVALAAAAGLDLDGFDIPGRTKRPKARAAPPPPPPPRNPEAEFADAARRFRDALDRSEAAWQQACAAAGVRSGETLHAARRRNFDEAAADAKRRDEARARNSAAREAADVLWREGMRCYVRNRDSMEPWAVEIGDQFHPADETLLVEIARIVVENGADAVLDALRAKA